MTLAGAILDVSAGEVGVRETAPNRGPMVDEYHRYADRDPALADSWCAEFIWWCVGHAADRMGVPILFRKSPSVERMWELNENIRVDGPPLPGDIFCMQHPSGGHHCGIYVSPAFGDGMFNSREGNTSAGGSRNGDGVYNRTRGISEITLGFLRPRPTQS